MDTPPLTPEDHLARILPDRPEPPEAAAALLAAIRTAGCTDDQETYEAACREAFARLDAYAAVLDTRRYLGGAAPGVEDWWLYAICVRFDVAYYPFYKLNRDRLADIGPLANWLRDLYQRPRIAETTDLAAIRAHYAADARTNPKQIVPRGPGPDLRVPHDRWRFDGATDRARGVEEDQTKARKEGEWVRPVSHHRRQITADGASGLPAQPGRYHLYVANNCPWSHRCALARAVLGLQDAISMDVLYYRRDPDRGWQFRPDAPGCTTDRIHGATYLAEIYEAVGSREKSVPVLWDRETASIVSNESADIVRMFGTAFRSLATRDLDLYPPGLRAEIDHVNAYTYTYINNGAYKAGFASSQAAYDAWFEAVFAALDWLDVRLRDRPYLLGDRLTEADLRLLPTLYRFDPIYAIRFRLDLKPLSSYPNTSAWLDRMLATPGVTEASNLDHCKRGYFGRTGNNLVPLYPTT